MSKYQLSLFAAMLLLVAGAQATVKDKCAMAMGKFPLDPERIVGTWYVISAATNHHKRDIIRCPKYELSCQKSKGDQKYLVKFTALDKDMQELSYEGISKPWITERHSNFVGVMKKSGVDNYDDFGVFMETILATDYDNYAVYMACRPTFDLANNDFSRQYRAAVFSRKPTLSEEVRKTLENLLAGYGFQESEFRVIDHTGCPE